VTSGFRRGLWLAAIVIAVVGGCAYFLILWPLRDPHPPIRFPSGALAIRDAKIYPSPDADAIEHGTVVVRNGLIAAVGPTPEVPSDARVLPCERCLVMAGFWNAHVHFTEPKWSFAAWKSSAALNAQLGDMFTSRGFTTVVDTGSDLRETVSLRRRIESGELVGPAIYTAGASVFPPGGIPYYLKGSVPFFVLWFVPQPATPSEAARIEERNIARGADLLKLFTGSYVARGKVLPMPEPIARAAAEVAHRHGQLVFSHASNLAGTKVAMNAGVDVLAHAPDSPQGIDAALLRAMVERNMAMVPTLKMFATTVTASPSYLQPIYDEVRQFHELGGQLLFGTDVGYMTDYSTEGEFEGLKKSGLGTRDVLRMLTAAPAQRFGMESEVGTVAVAKRADLVVIDADPTQDIAAFARVRYTIRNGRVLYSR